MTGSTSSILECPPREDTGDAELHRALHATLYSVLNDSANPAIVRDAIQHHLSAAGGYLRARIGYRAGRALGLSHTDALDCACISELLHNASLIHDDVLDHDRVRRGQASVWHVWNESVAICLGDLFISAAYGIIARLENYALHLPALLRRVHDHVHTTINGQAGSFTLALESTPDFERYCQAACGKSGPLFALSLEAPLTLLGYEKALEPARSAALAFATVYQLVDDIEDFESDMACQGQGICNMLHALEVRGDAHPKRAALDYGLQRLGEVRRDAAALPRDCGRALIEETDRLEARLHVVTEGEHRPLGGGAQ